MKKFIVSIFISFIVSVTLAQPKPYLAEDLVGIVGEQPVLLSEWKSAISSITEFRKQYGNLPDAAPVEIEAIESVLAQKLLIQCAIRDSLGKNISDFGVSGQVDEMVTRMANEIGGVKALEALYGKPIYQIKEDVKTSVMESELATSMQNDIRDKCKISIPEVREFYETVGKDTLPMIPPQYCYAQIVCVPEATEEKQFEIREKLLDYRERVLNGERLSVLARMYSMAHDGSPQKGGEIGPIDINGLVPPFIAALDQLKPGQVSEVVETEYGFHIVELISRQGDMVHFRHLLLTPEFSVEQTERVTKVLDSVANLIRNGDLTFEKAALEYSNERSTKYNGGKVFNDNIYKATGSLEQTSTYFMAEELTPVDFRHISPLKVGEVSDCYQTINSNGFIVYKIVKLLDFRDSHPMSIDYEFSYVKSFAFEQKCNKSIEDWIVDEIKNMYIYIKPEYQKLAFSQPQWIERSKECEKTSYFDNIVYSSSVETQNNENTEPNSGDAVATE